MTIAKSMLMRAACIRVCCALAIIQADERRRLGLRRVADGYSCPGGSVVGPGEILVYPG
jgi:hypothetical protein